MRPSDRQVSTPPQLVKNENLVCYLIRARPGLVHHVVPAVWTTAGAAAMCELDPGVLQQCDQTVRHPGGRVSDSFYYIYHLGCLSGGR